jgi:signal transduction histidine kinase
VEHGPCEIVSGTADCRGMVLYRTLLRSLIVLIVFWAGTAAAVTLQRDTLHRGLGAHIEVLEDPRADLDIDAVRSPAFNDRFKPARLSGDAINLGFAGTTYWLRLRLQRTPDAPERWLIELPYVPIKYVDFYVEGLPPVLTGMRRPLSSRPLRDRYFVLPLNLATDEQTVYLRLSSNYPLILPLHIWQPDARAYSEGNALLMQYLYYGCLLALIVYNLMLSLLLRDRRFLLYVLYALPLGFGILAGNGLGRMLLWPESSVFDGIAQSCLLGFAGVMGTAFAREFLQTRVRSPRLDRVLMLTAGVLGLLSALLLASVWWDLPVIWINQMVFVTGACMGLLVLLVSVREYWLRQRGAGLFLLGWAIFWSGVLVGSLRGFDVLPTNIFTTYSIQISSTFEMMVFSIALAELVRVERRARERAQTEAYQASLRAGERLDAEVRLRTAELNHSSDQLRERGRQLEEALLNEQQVLAQYVRFGSMISHEFRNPLAVIDSQVQLLDKERAQGHDSIDERLPVIRGAVSRLSFMFDQWLASDRLSRSLNDIAPHPVPLREWLEHVIDGLYWISEHRVEVHFDPQVRHINADDHLLEIALSNLIENASKYSPSGTLIRIETRWRPGQAGIAVIDQGPGIALEHQQAVFTDFYRVQPEGSVRGMGLGLSIVQRIVKAHGGELTLKSTLGQGCCFCMWLPMASTPLSAEDES